MRVWLKRFASLELVLLGSCSPKPRSRSGSQEGGARFEPKGRDRALDDDGRIGRNDGVPRTVLHVDRLRVVRWPPCERASNKVATCGNSASSGRKRCGPRKASPMSSSRVLSLGFLGLFVVFPGVMAACAKSENFGGPPPCVGLQCVDGGGPVSLVPTASGSAMPSGSVASSATASVAPSATSPVPRASADIIDQGIEVSIRQQALKVAQKGAMPDPQVLRVDLAEGEHVGVTYTLQPNVCYTVIASAVPGVVKELEVKLLLPPFFTMEAGKGKGFPAVIGRTPTAICPISPIPIPYRIDVTATKGSGRVGLMVFAKPK